MIQSPSSVFRVPDFKDTHHRLHEADTLLRQADGVLPFLVVGETRLETAIGVPLQGLEHFEKWTMGRRSREAAVGLVRELKVNGVPSPTAGQAG